MELELVFCELCNCRHGIGSAACTCLAQEIQSLEDASTHDLLRFEEELDTEEEE